VEHGFVDQRLKYKLMDHCFAGLGFIAGRWSEWKIYCHAPLGAITDPYGFIEYIIDFPPLNKRDPEPPAITRIREWAHTDDA